MSQQQQPQKLVAFHGRASLKRAQLKVIKEKIANGQLVHGTYGEMRDGVMKGCAVFITTCHSDSPHEHYETLFGIPQVIAKLEDVIFEGLREPHDKEWPVKFWEAIPVGADLSLVNPRCQHWLMQENLKHEKIWREQDKEDEYTSKVVAAIKTVSELMQKWFETGIVDESVARSARSVALSAWSAWSAQSAAESAARSAWSAAESAAWSARSVARSVALSAWSAWSAQSAAESAARSAWSAAESAAWSARSVARSAQNDFHIRCSEKLLELLRAAPVTKEAKTTK